MTSALGINRKLSAGSNCKITRLPARKSHRTRVPGNCNAKASTRNSRRARSLSRRYFCSGEFVENSWHPFSGPRHPTECTSPLRLEPSARATCRLSTLMHAPSHPMKTYRGTAGCRLCTPLKRTGPRGTLNRARAQRPVRASAGADSASQYSNTPVRTASQCKAPSLPSLRCRPILPRSCEFPAETL